jgi:hypothetical protein
VPQRKLTTTAQEGCGDVCTEPLHTGKQCKDKVLLSGYASTSYDAALAGWHRHTQDVAVSVARGRVKGKGRRTEVMWTNC